MLEIEVSEDRNNPVYLLTSELTEERASILDRLLNYYMRFMASAEIDGPPGAAISVRSTPSRLSISSLSFIGFRYLFSLRSSKLSPEHFDRMYTIFQRMEISGNLFSHNRERQRRERACCECNDQYINNCENVSTLVRNATHKVSLTVNFIICYAKKKKS